MGLGYVDRSSHFAGMSDEDIVTMAQRGCASAAEYMVIRYRNLVESKGRTYFLPGADHDDVVQEGMIGLYKAIRDFRGDRFVRFRAFADVCVTRQIITAIKAASRLKHSPLNNYISFSQSSPEADAEIDLLDRIPDDRAKDPSCCIDEPRDARAVCTAMGGALSDLESAVLGYYLEGWSYREISRSLQCGTKSIDNALQRIKRKVGAALDGCDEPGAPLHAFAAPQ